MKKLICLFIICSVLSGCLYDLAYFRHYPTHKLAIGELSEKDFANNPSYVSNGILVLPYLKSLRESHPDPYSKISFASVGVGSIYFKGFSLTDASGKSIFEKNVEALVPIDRERPNNIYRSLSIDLMRANNIDLTSLLKKKTVSLNCIVSKNKTTDKTETITFKLKLRKKKEIAWAT